MGTPAEMLNRVMWLAGIRRLSANKISERSGHPDAVRNLQRMVERGKGRGWSDEIVSEIARVLQCTPSWLRGEAGAPEPDIPRPDIRENLAEQERLKRQAQEIAQKLRSLQDEIDPSAQEDTVLVRRQKRKVR